MDAGRREFVRVAGLGPKFPFDLSGFHDYYKLKRAFMGQWAKGSPPSRVFLPQGVGLFGQAASPESILAYGDIDDLFNPAQLTDEQVFANLPIFKAARLIAICDEKAKKGHQPTLLTYLAISRSFAYDVIVVGPGVVSTVDQVRRFSSPGRTTLAAERAARTGAGFAEELKSGTQAMLPGLMDRTRYRKVYKELIAALKQAGSQGHTYDEALRVCPKLKPGDVDSLFTVLGQVSGAESNRWWSVREAGAWVVKETDGPTIVINFGPKKRSWFGLSNKPANLLPPRSGNDLLGHLGHVHPQFGKLKLSPKDIATLEALYDRNPLHQTRWPVIAGPKGEWRRTDELDYMFSLMDSINKSRGQ